jgi:hypothetical protein
MKSNQFIMDAENSSTSIKVEKIFLDYGYTKIGSGTDKTAWFKEGNSIVGIIMPANKNINNALKAMISLFNLGEKYPDNKHFPKFIKFKDDSGVDTYFKEFKVDNRTFIQYAMERYYHIDNPKIFELINMLRKFASRNLDIYHVKNLLKNSTLNIDYEELYETIKIILNEAPNDIIVDIFDEKNVMRKSDNTIVFVDPYYSISKGKR